jgi:hypothetical protein
MDFSTIASVGGLISATIGATKNARDLAKDSSDHALKEQIGDIYDGLFELRERILALDEENRKLKAALVEKAAYIGLIPPHGYVYAGTDTEHQHPLCPTCYQSKPQKIGVMGEAQDWNGGIRRGCKLCGHHVYEREMELGRVTRVRRDYDPYS